MSKVRGPHRGWMVGLAVAIGLGLAAAPLVVRGSAGSMAHAEAGAAVSPAAYVPQKRVYYIAAEELPWNYAPNGMNEITGQPFDDAANVFVQRASNRIGSTYVKALYREYTDASFTTLKPRSAAWAHLGMLGPMVRAVVGDTVEINFKNKTSRPTSIHMHGFKYKKDSEGAPYEDGTSGADKGDDAVPPGQSYTYRYEVPDTAGPGPMEGSSVMWMYHSHADEVADDYAGLVGPVIVTRAEMARPDGTPTDVDREFVVQFKVSDENASPYLDQNIKTYALKPPTVKQDEAFGESNLMHTMNGYVFGNLPIATMTANKGERVRWYLSGMGTEVDLHTPHWHGNTVVSNGMRTDVVSLLPMTMVTADMKADNPGTWLFHCHVNDHITAGMIARYRVVG
jgi:FtsP/CotA-like multicopper oxidase with cupredoxin domain